ncbi:hypothetical protein [Pseudobacteroides cellulosolvens]|uniref:Uncharacterized protein n=1 Tax=Pseudobacteroides cellulosolvens ATCC 35603 = DSM 2933 TaxID=398512 RepID=A0A0L6JKF2_9FIRM|nr:hypothetical protein [Pseudobacteroides cellulosolvens]KNY25857.1 hypothetical protein Bccel_1117 [Pseudobacteroides cellulosolvens ATCC 35603 = DSM 2933]
MKITQKTITVHGGHEIFLLTPLMVNSNITSGHDNKGYVLIWGNGSGYKFLAECFSVASELKKNEILYLPAKFKGNDEFIQVFGNCDYNLNIVCTNYCETQISLKDIEKILKTKVCSEQIIDRSPIINTKYIERWKTDRRLTVKIYKRYLHISTNRDGFSSLAYGAGNMAEYGDVYYNFFPHVHYDWDENTYKSVGVNLYHWHNK